MPLELSNTTGSNTLSYSLPSIQHHVSVHFPGSDIVSERLAADSTHRIIEVPIHSRWTPGAHWHEDYTEHIRVLKGTAKVWINGKMKILGTGETATFQIFDVHEFCRDAFDDGDDLWIEEWTDDENGTKDVFFRNAFSIVGDTEKFGGLPWAFMRFFYLCSYRDNHIAFLPPSTPMLLQRAATNAVFGSVRLTGNWAGWKSWYSEYTPEYLQSLAENGITQQQKDA